MMGGMSYDVWLEIDTGGPEPVAITEWNYTSNCAAMWRHAGADLAEFDGLEGGEAAFLLAPAIARMEIDPEAYQAMNPKNGWGSYRTLVPALKELLTQFRAHPRATVKVSR